MNAAQPLLTTEARRQIWAPALVARRIEWLEARRASDGLTAIETVELEALDRRRIARLCRQLEAA